MKRRDVLAGSGAALLSAGVARAAVPGMNPGLPQGTLDEVALATLPGKKPLLRLSDRPPNYEATMDAFATPITPNDRFFVRYHLAGIPEMAELRNWKLTVGGDAAGKEVSFTLPELRSLPQHQFVAVCQCSGNRRGLFQPHVAGVEWGTGAMGCARWTGVRLKDVLNRAGVKAGALEVILHGADGPVLPATPDFAKSIPMQRALDDDTLIAYEMNGAPLPHLNGFPIRLIVPGWTATYWMKHLNQIEISSKPLQNFWMAAAYRVPAGMFPVAHPFASQTNAQSTPITEIVVNSLVTNVADGATVKPGFEIKGIAWDSGSGIRTVETSLDGGAHWAPASLGQDLGHYAFRPFSAALKAAPGAVKVMVRATSNAGEVQVDKLKFNPAGYHHNVIQTLALTVA
ncbi:MAG: oxidase [Acetobacteraceae bacterium SCN 69-10]|nr:molybdopterin-dependent oxidoreductase [Rhodospirillales bacterium]ODU56370.1 MAG: oxidase [Acetobacteraceae bacterium SCN 69-10]OJY65083.1 MAG: oxidase [Rhodospirillales bacterium 70-18]